MHLTSCSLLFNYNTRDQNEVEKKGWSRITRRHKGTRRKQKKYIQFESRSSVVSRCKSRARKIINKINASHTLIVLTLALANWWEQKFPEQSNFYCGCGRFWLSDNSRRRHRTHHNKRHVNYVVSIHNKLCTKHSRHTYMAWGSQPLSACEYAAMYNEYHEHHVNVNNGVVNDWNMNTYSHCNQCQSFAQAIRPNKRNVKWQKGKNAENKSETLRQQLFIRQILCVFDCCWANNGINENRFSLRTLFGTTDDPHGAVGSWMEKKIRKILVTTLWPRIDNDICVHFGNEIVSLSHQQMPNQKRFE